MPLKRPHVAYLIVLWVEAVVDRENRLVVAVFGLVLAVFGLDAVFCLDNGVFGLYPSSLGGGGGGGNEVIL